MGAEGRQALAEEGALVGLELIDSTRSGGRGWQRPDHMVLYRP